MVLISKCFVICITLVTKMSTQSMTEEPLQPLEFNDIANVLALNLFHVMPAINLVASTLMVRLPLIKLAGVANGETKAELMKALGFKNETWMRGAYARLREKIAILLLGDLLYVNKIYVNQSSTIHPRFIANSEYEYGVKAEIVAFRYPLAVVSHINRWMSTSTLRRIVDIVDINDINANTSMVIANGVHFKATWEFPFNYARTRLEQFHHINGSISYVHMMVKVNYFEYVDTGEYQATWEFPFNYARTRLEQFHHINGSISYVHMMVKVNYFEYVDTGEYQATWEFPFNYARTRLEQFHHINGSISYVHMMVKVNYFEYVDTGEYQAVKLRLMRANTHMIFLLPHSKDALPYLLEKMYADPNYLTPFLNRMTVDRPIVVKIPRFNMKTYVDWTGFLQDMGVVSIFNCNTSDLFGMFNPGFGPNDRMCLSKIKQKVFLEVDEMGANRRPFSRVEDGALAENMADRIGSTSFRELIFD